MSCEKGDKMRGLSRILSLFRDELNTLNNSGAGMLNSVYSMTLTLLEFGHIYARLLRMSLH